MNHGQSNSLMATTRTEILSIQWQEQWCGGPVSSLLIFFITVDIQSVAQ